MPCGFRLVEFLLTKFLVPNNKRMAFVPEERNNFLNEPQMLTKLMQPCFCRQQKHESLAIHNSSNRSKILKEVFKDVI